MSVLPLATTSTPVEASEWCTGIELQVHHSMQLYALAGEERRII